MVDPHGALTDLDVVVVSMQGEPFRQSDIDMRSAMQEDQLSVEEGVWLCLNPECGFGLERERLSLAVMDSWRHQLSSIV